MAKKKLTEEQQKQLKLLEANNEMYERSKKEAMERGRENAVKQIEFAQNDIKAQIAKLLKGENVESMEIINIDENTPSMTITRNSGENDDSVFEAIEKGKKKKAKERKSAENVENTGTQSNSATNVQYTNIDSNVQYDLVPLPSNGECYENKINRLPVGFLTAYDENFITSPNLYRDGLVIDFLLKNKVLSNDIDVDNLVKGDVDAIVLFLRATSYGVEFPVVVKDPETGVSIETNIDLSKIKTKPFNLKSDENGHFSFTLPSGVEVKFKYLTRKEEKDLEFISNLENDATKTTTLRAAVRTIKESAKNDTVLSSNDKTIIDGHLKDIEKWIDELEKENPSPFNKMITNRMEMQIVAINGNYDKEYVRKAIMNMPAGEALKLRRYILENEPGLDFEVEIERPQNLGGGSFKTFLEWDDSIFFNIA
jgi:hypothetical protein